MLIADKHFLDDPHHHYHTQAYNEYGPIPPEFPGPRMEPGYGPAPISVVDKRDPLQFSKYFPAIMDCLNKAHDIVFTSEDCTTRHNCFTDTNRTSFHMVPGKYYINLLDAQKKIITFTDDTSAAVAFYKVNWLDKQGFHSFILDTLSTDFLGKVQAQTVAETDLANNIVSGYTEYNTGKTECFGKIDATGLLEFRSFLLPVTYLSKYYGIYASVYPDDMNDTLFAENTYATTTATAAMAGLCYPLSKNAFRCVPYYEMYYFTTGYTSKPSNYSSGE